MNAIYALPEDELRDGIYRRIFLLIIRNRGTWPAFGAVGGLFGGLLSIVLGVLDWAVVGLFAPAGAAGSFLNAAGAVLCVLSFPLLALGAHCLDLLEKSPRAPLPAESRPDAPRPTLLTHVERAGG
jgi:hypothetical protein